MVIRPEIAADTPAIHDLIGVAFRDLACSNGTEAGIVDALRTDAALTLSLVAVENTVVVGHAAFSPVAIDSTASGWFGLGPVAVRRENRRRGIGRQLIEAGLDELRTRDARGCVVLGDPAYYARFGFAPDPALFFAGAPSAYFQCLRFRGEQPSGEVHYHLAFGAA